MNAMLPIHWASVPRAYLRIREKDRDNGAWLPLVFRYEIVPVVRWKRKTGKTGPKTSRDKLTTVLSYCIHIHGQIYVDTNILLFTKAPYNYVHTSHF